MSDSRFSNPGRFDALDTLRCLAVLVMVQGHAFYVTLAASERSEPWYAWHNYLHGYTAPAFLFGAGLAFGYTTLTDKIAAHASWGPTLHKRLYRYLSLFAIGYAIQLPPLAVATKKWAAESVQTFLRVEALQHIGAALLCAQLLVIWLRRPLRVALAASGLAVAIVLLGPAMSRVPVASWGSPALAAYMSLDAGSTFPLVPWAGFVMAGIVVGASVFQARKYVSARWLALAFVGVGLASVLCSLWLDRVAPNAFGSHFYWKTSPYFFLRRLGWVLVMLGGFALIDSLLPKRGGAPSTSRRWIRLVSQHSLVAYVGHLVLLYGSPFSPGLRMVVAGNLGLLGSVLLVLAMFGLLALLLSQWQTMQERFEPRFRVVRQWGVAVMAVAALVAAVRTTSYRMPDAVPRVVIADGKAAPTAEPRTVAGESQPAAPVREESSPVLKAAVGTALSALQ